MRTASILSYLFSTLLFIGPASGQSRRSINPESPAQERGKVVVHRTLAFVPSSAPELFRQADVVIRGRVSSVLPARMRRDGDPTTLETDFIVTIAKMYKGPTGLVKLVVSEPGGILNGFEARQDQDLPLMSDGDYFLFLTADSRPGIPRIQNLSRFYILSAWNGKFMVSNGRITVGPEAVQTLRALQGSDAGSFDTMLLKVAKEATPAPSPR